MPLHTFASSRTTFPDPVALLAQVRAIDATAGVAPVLNLAAITVKKNTDWTPADIATVQAAIDSAPALTAQRQAQNEIDNWPISQKALVLSLIDALNTLRTNPALNLPAITPAQALAAVRAKAATL